MTNDELNGVLDFLRRAEALKSTRRSAWTSSGEPETVAAHTWRLCLLALVLRDELGGADLARLLSICIVHDLGEAIGGDIPAIHQTPGASKAEQERADLVELIEPLPERLRAHVLELWDEYEHAQTREARLAKALDKLETILQHNQGRNPPDFDYAFNLDYGRKHTSSLGPLIDALRATLDRETARRAGQAEPDEPGT